MTAFDHLVRGTDAAAWDLDALAPITGLPSAGDRVVVVAAHPDDETLGAGGLLALCARRGVEVVVVVASDGEASHPRSPTTAPAVLATTRREEVVRAVATAAPDARVHFLGLPDGALAAHHAALLAQVTHFAHGATHVVSPWAGDRHPDHEACAQAADGAAASARLRHWQYPIWAWHWGDPAGDDLPRAALRRLELDDGLHATKLRALACHVSQHSPLSDRPGDEAILPPAILAHFTGTSECFVVAEGGAGDASDPSYFDALYARSDDPWGLGSRFYEQRKRALVLAALPRARFRRAFEPGCATGLLTEQLAERCDEVVAWDVSDRAVTQTRERVPGARVSRGVVPADWPAGAFDLVVLSEVGYYCPDVDVLADRVLAGLADDGVVVGCHWRHPAPDHPHTAQNVHRALDRRLRPLVTHVEDDFLLQVWSRSGRSVAVESGIVA